jgi:ABC-type Fe3+/spermidine/putrescine transport system ATPase subunit
VLEFVGDLFTDESRTQIANAIVESPSKPLLDPKTGALAADLRAIVAETLKIAREETKT